MEKKIWKITTESLETAPSDVMEDYLRAVIKKEKSSLLDMFPDKNFQTKFRQNDGTLEGKIIWTGDPDTVNSGPDFAALTFAAFRSKDAGQDQNTWKVVVENVINAGEQTVKRYLCQQAMHAVIRQAADVSATANLEYTKLPEDVELCEGDVLSASAETLSGDFLNFTAVPYGDDSRKFHVAKQSEEIKDVISCSPGLPVFVVSNGRWEGDEEAAQGLYTWPQVKCYTARVLNYDYTGERMLITTAGHLHQCIEAELTDRGIDFESEKFDVLFDKEVKRMEPYWTDAVIIETKD